MLTWIKYLDRVIRGEATQPASLRKGDIEQPVGGLAVIGALLGVLYGLCMGCYGLFQKGGGALPQLMATMLKVPVLFFLTLAVTFPSLYVFNALVGSRLSALSVLRLLVISLAVMLTVLASLGPIVAFFSASTSSYPFMLLLNVLIFTISGFLGLRYMLMTLHRLSAAPVQTTPAPLLDLPPLPGQEFSGPQSAQNSTSAAGDPPLHPAGTTPPARPPASAPMGALDSLRGTGLSRDVKTVFRVWMVVFGLVGAQMAWVLRPFLGSPERAFSWFRGREANFFEAVFHAIHRLFS